MGKLHTGLEVKQMSYVVASVLASGEVVKIAGLGALGVALTGLTIWLLTRKKISPAERERRRRSSIQATGRMGDGNINDIRDHVLYYSYEVRGVYYTAAQDLSSLQEHLPPNTSKLAGAVSVSGL